MRKKYDDDDDEECSIYLATESIGMGKYLRWDEFGGK